MPLSYGAEYGARKARYPSVLRPNAGRPRSFPKDCLESLSMRIVRIYTDAAGESHFDEIFEKGVEHRVNADFSRLIEAYGLMFKETKAQGGEPALGGWHTAPQRQYVLFLAGKTEIEVSDGEKRILKTGDVLLVEDTTGKGHRNRRLSAEPELWAFVRSAHP